MTSRISSRQEQRLCLARCVGSLFLQEEIDRAVKLNYHLCFTKSITGEYLLCFICLQILLLKEWDSTAFTNPSCLYLFDFISLITPRENSYHMCVARSLLQFPRFKGSDCRSVHVMTNPAEGQPLCARQASTLCSRIEFWWTNPHIHRSTSC